MKKIRAIILIAFLISFLFMLSSCDTMTIYDRPGYGPPAHAKAHGLRNKQSNTVVILRTDK